MHDPETISTPDPESGVAPHDEALPSVPVLLGPGASAALAPAVAQAGGTIESIRPRFVQYRPGSRIAVRYGARVAWPDGRRTEETLAAAERVSGPPSKAIPVEVAGTTIGVWRWPDDPRLPGLRAATDPEFVRRMLDELGASPGPIQLSYRAYWPTSRAVVQAVIPSQKLRFDPARGTFGRPAAERLLFVKVVRPDVAEQLGRLHETLIGELPIARCLGWSHNGLVVLEALPGQTIYASLNGGGPPPPGGEELLGLLRTLERFDFDVKPRRTIGGKVVRHVQLLKAVVPDQAELLDRFAETYGEERRQPRITIHGDFHEDQILFADRRVTGLLDVDDVGPGQRVDDLALITGRVIALAHFAKRDRERVQSYADHLLETFGREVDPNELRRRISGALLGRATAPFRGQARGWRAATRERIQLAERWLARCEREGVLG